MITSKARIFLTADKAKAVPAGDAEAHILLVSEGGRCDETELEKIPDALELATGTAKKAKKEK